MWNKRHRLLIVALIAGAVIIAVIHLDLARIFHNPMFAMIGLVFVITHLIGGGIVAAIMFLGKKRWSTRR